MRTASLVLLCVARLFGSGAVCAYGAVATYGNAVFYNGLNNGGRINYGLGSLFVGISGTRHCHCCNGNNEYRSQSFHNVKGFN